MKFKKKKKNCPVPPTTFTARKLIHRRPVGQQTPWPAATRHPHSKAVFRSHLSSSLPRHGRHHCRRSSFQHSTSSLVIQLVTIHTGEWLDILYFIYIFYFPCVFVLKKCSSDISWEAGSDESYFLYIELWISVQKWNPNYSKNFSALCWPLMDQPRTLSYNI